MQLNFNARNVAPSQGRVPLPADVYVMKVVESEITPTKDGTGRRLNLTFEVLGGQYSGRKVIQGINIINKSAVAQQIGQEELSAICHAIGVLDVQDTGMLHNIPLKCKVKVVPERDGYDAKNEIIAYRNVNDNSLGGTNGGAAIGGTPPSAPQGGVQAPAGFGGGQPPAQPWQAQQAQPAAPQPAVAQAEQALAPAPQASGWQNQNVTQHQPHMQAAEAATTSGPAGAMVDDSTPPWARA